MNLAKHLGTFSWAVAAKLLPLIYGAVLILVVYAAIPVAENGRYWIVFASFSWIALLNKSLILYPMLRFAAVPADFQPVIRASFWLNAVFYTLLGFIVLLISPLAAEVFNIQAHDFYMITWLLSAFFIRDFVFCVQQIKFKTGRIFVIEAVYYLGSVAGIIAFASGGKLYSAVEVWQINLWSAVASSVIALSFGFGGVGLFGKIEISTMKRIAAYGRDTLGLGISNGLLYAADTWMIGHFFTLRDVGLYNGAKSVWRVLSSINQAVGIIVLPYISRLESEGKVEERKALFEKITAYTFVGLIAATIMLAILAQPFYAYFINGKYVGAAALLWIMLIGTPFEGIYNSSGQIMYGIGKARTVATVALGSLGVFLAAMWIGGNLFGTYGIASALSLSLITSGIWMYFWTAHHLGTDTINVLRRLGLGISGFLRGDRN